MVEKAYGSSSRGKMHKQNKIPNQDYYLIDNREIYTLAVVCDGLGSKKYSHYASKKLCRLIKKEVRYRYKKNNLIPYEMVETIQIKYRRKIWPFKLINCDTTCIFVIVSKKSILMFQLGDGLLAVKDKDIELADSEEKDFANETIPFGSSTSKDWKIKMLTKKEGIKYEMLLCSDGISEDLILKDLSSFIEGLSNMVNGKYENNKVLSGLLENWPNKYSTDDKTIVVVK